MDAPAADPASAGPTNVAWHTTVLVALVCATVLVAAVGRWALLAPGRRLPGVPGSLLPAEVVSPLFAVALTVLGALVVARGKPRRYGWLLLAMGATNAVVGFAADYSVYAVLGGAATLPLTRVAGWAQDLWMITWVSGFLLLPALSPDGEPGSERWGRWVRAVAKVWIVLIGSFAPSPARPSGAQVRATLPITTSTPRHNGTRTAHVRVGAPHG